jgi:hypothetical protein
VLQHAGGFVREQARNAVRVRPLGGDYAVVVEQPAFGERFVVLETRRRKRTEDRIARVKNPALRVAE